MNYFQPVFCGDDFSRSIRPHPCLFLRVPSTDRIRRVGRSMDATTGGRHCQRSRHSGRGGTQQAQSGTFRMQFVEYERHDDEQITMFLKRLKE